jgi:DNA-binding CsgD family transcriptional regulator
MSPEALASLISSSGSNNFGNSLLNLFQDSLGIIACLGYKYSANEHSPRKLMSSHKLCFNNLEEINNSIDSWIASDYDNDPLFKYIQYNSASIPSTHFVDIGNLKSSDKKSEVIVEKYYDPFEIGEEITWSYKTDESLFTINMCRHQSSARLTTQQKSFLTRISNFVVQSTIQHSKLMQLNDRLIQPASIEHVGQQAVLPSEDRNLQLEKITGIFTQLNLTSREAEICAYITQGYSAIAISLILNISINTIATHRKRAYAKLSISSQRELFSLIYKQKII